MFAHAARVTFALIFFRGGPEDFPHSLPLTRACALLALLASWLLLEPLLPTALALATAIGGVAGVAFFTGNLLRARKLPNRLLQTLGAQLAVGAVFAVALWPAFQVLAPAMLQLLKNPESAAKLRAGIPVDVQVPPWASLTSDLLFFWNLAVTVRINRRAAELSMPMGLLLTFAGLFVLLSFVTLAQLVVLMFTASGS